MIETKSKVAKITPLKVVDNEAFKKAGSVYNSVKEELSFKVNESTGVGWRLAHDGGKVLALIEGTKKSTTGTIHTLVEFATEKEALAEIKKLGLIDIIK